MRYARTGYIDRHKVLVAEPVFDEGHISYRTRHINPEIFAGLPGPVDDGAKCPSFNDIMGILYNVALGQRVTTPEYANQFIDRHGKTFFRENAHIDIALRQECVTNISALSNYVNMTSWNPEMGSVETIYTYYRYIQAGLAFALLERLKKDVGGDTEIVNDKKRCALKQISVDEETRQMLKDAVPGREEALALVEGILACCCWRDHSATDKDRHNSKIRAALRSYQPMMDVIAFDDPDRFWTLDSVSALFEIASCDRRIWIVPDQSDEIVDILHPERKA